MYVAIYLCVVIITSPPENITACRGNRVKISCGYHSATPLPVTWIINGTSYTEDDIMNMKSSYQLNSLATPSALSLSVSPINGNTTFQCVVHSTLNTIISTVGTVTVTTGMYIAIHSVTYVGGTKYSLVLHRSQQKPLQIRINMDFCLNIKTELSTL